MGSFHYRMCSMLDFPPSGANPPGEYYVRHTYNIPIDDDGEGMNRNGTHGTSRVVTRGLHFASKSRIEFLIEEHTVDCTSLIATLSSRDNHGAPLPLRPLLPPPPMSKTCVVYY